MVLDGTRNIQISLKRYALSMENIMVAGAFGRAMNYGSDGHFKENDEVLTYTQSSNISEQYDE